jgi:molecular chaperone GrpE
MRQSQQSQGSQGSQGISNMGDEEQNPVRVTDRRRISLDQEKSGETGGQSGAEVETPNLKPSYVEELEIRTKAAERQVQEVQARFDQLRQQLQRETDETRVRLNRSADERAEAGKAKFIESLLPVLDDLERAVEAAEKEGQKEGTHDAIVQGVRSIAVRFQAALTSAGVEPLVSVGEQFDPELHEAVDTAETDPEMDGIVVSEYSRGFRIGERLLRPARVKVGRAEQSTKESTDYTEDSSRRRHESAG